MKNELRKFAIEKRKTLNCRELSKKTMHNLFLLPEYRASRNLICYYPLKYEIDTTECLSDKSKKIYLPRVKGNSMEICPMGKMRSGCYGIMEPQTEAVNDYSESDIVIIPACAADEKGFRLGYGKGFYDRFLPLLPKTCIKIVLVYSCLLFESVFPDKYDVKADIIVSDERILKIM